MIILANSYYNGEGIDPIKKENSEFVLKSMENVRKFSVRPENIRKRSCFGTFSGCSILDKFRTNSGVSRKCLEFVRPENVPKRDCFRMEIEKNSDKLFIGIKKQQKMVLKKQCLI
ncbi:hypothetical protein RIR_jg2884.t1 [Rhizophagus irregularis DAOM 181602=DAOM 197198]|nr:hypothetical protein RIR_jg2884.t1 [Rhizophagus irregularis DAOM 181602=DAOM 197198]